MENLILIKCAVANEVQSFLSKAVMKWNERISEHFSYKIEVRKGRKFYLVDMLYFNNLGENISTSSFCAIDFEGNIFKRNGYKAVDRNIRGNVNSVHNGSESLDHSGFIVSLR